MSHIRLRNLNFSYKTDGREVQILKNLNLDIERGDLVAIQGPSGSGKSTLLYIIGCLLNTYSGDVFIEGQNVSTLPDDELAVLRNEHIGFVFQQFHLLPKATVLENILVPSFYPTELPEKPKAQEKAMGLISDLGLQGREHHLPNQLSGGQQQRVAIGRALLNEPEIILADEPTGSLDTKSSQQILDLLKQAHNRGCTVVIITHDPEIAAQCHKVVHFRDGEIQQIQSKDSEKLSEAVKKKPRPSPSMVGLKNIPWLMQFQMARRLLPLTLQNIYQNKSRSALTMIGIVMGVSAVLAMLTIGSFTKAKILDSYAELGVNSIAFTGSTNWNLKATDVVPAVFQTFDWEKDIEPLKKIFPEIEKISPMLSSYNDLISFGGRTVDSDARVMGISEDAMAIIKRSIVLGTNISSFHVKNRSPVCLIGTGIYERLFRNSSPLGQIISISKQDTSYNCRVIGIMGPQVSNKEWNKPNMHVYLPYTTFQAVADPWFARIRNVVLQIRAGEDTVSVGNKMKALFEKKYGKSGDFNVGSDSVLIAQMQKFLNLFTVLLGVIALVSLAVGGIGIANMMLVSVAERYKEIGIRKAFGATNLSIQTQFLVEAVVLCSIAGAIGLVVGFALYQSAIYAATKFISSVKFEWVFDFTAFAVSTLSIFVVGVLSGLTPAIKAEKLQVIEALRSE